MEKAWFIINLADMDAVIDRNILSERRRPKYVHLNREKAEQELLRLAEKYPSGEFVLFEAVAVAAPQVTNPEIFEINEIGS